MIKLDSAELREKYIGYFKNRGHAVIPSASLIPDNDPTVLFTTAGMHPLVPYLLGQSHPAGKRLVNVQKCVRTGDIDEVGDDTHCTFFEMLGNWSLGDYFKRQSIMYSFEFLTKELNIPTDRLAVSCFEGDSDSPKDTESCEAWLECGIMPKNVFFLPKKNNWWGPAGITGPCGPDTEIFIITDKPPCGERCSPACDCGRYIEIWNNVFMEYDKQPDGGFKPLTQKNVDTGMGLERTVAVLNGHTSVYETDVFSPVMALLDERSSAPDGTRQKRIVADHIRTATFMLGDEKGILPSNVDQGYVLRRLIRRAVRYARVLGIKNELLIELSGVYVRIYGGIYKELERNSALIYEELAREIERFNKTLDTGLKEFEKLLKYIQNNRISGKAAFRLYDTFGFPVEMTAELAADHGITVDLDGYDTAFAEHQKKSQAGAEQKFKGGLADNAEATARLHTATHLLLSALKNVLGESGIRQKGSNITAERLRFDFNFHRPLTQDELAAVENTVNEAIKKRITITVCEMPLDEAKKAGAEGVFDDRYEDKVKVYTIAGYSKEICGGPHAANTAELGAFKITKEQSCAAGIRRIKAIISSDGE